MFGHVTILSLSPYVCIKWEGFFPECCARLSVGLSVLTRVMSICCNSSGNRKPSVPLGQQRQSDSYGLQRDMTGPKLGRTAYRAMDEGAAMQFPPVVTPRSATSERDASRQQ